MKYIASTELAYLNKNNQVTKNKQTISIDSPGILKAKELMRILRIELLTKIDKKWKIDSDEIWSRGMKNFAPIDKEVVIDFSSIDYYVNLVEEK